MALEFDADFDATDDSYGHGVSATYTPSGGSASTIKVILEDEYLSVDGLTVGVEGSTPVAYCKTKMYLLQVMVILWLFQHKLI